MSYEPPLIDTRDKEHLLRHLRTALHYYCPEWKGKESLESDNQVEALAQIFSRMMEIIIKRVNKIPEKSFLAFLDMIGIRLIPPRVATAPLTFSLVSGAKTFGLVPAGAQVAAESPNAKGPIIFETKNSLTVILPGLEFAISISPQTDRWTDHSPDLFGEDKKESPVMFMGKDLTPHIIYFGHKDLFSLEENKDVILNIGLTKNMTGVEKDCDVGWYYYSEDSPGPIPLLIDEKNTTPKTAKLLQSGAIRFKNVPKISEKILTGFEYKTGREISRASCWIFAHFKTPLPDKQLPKIRKAETAVVIVPPAPLPPDLVFFNNTPLDLSKDFQPFGERPKFNDIFHIGSKKVFSKEGAQITCTIELTGKEKANASDDIVLLWEYWNGKKWDKIAQTPKKGIPTAKPAGLFSFIDSTEALAVRGDVRFSCPQIIASEIAGEENYWIRVRLIKGDYGKEASYGADETITTDIKSVVDGKETTTTVAYKQKKYLPASFAPPSIKSVNLNYEFKPALKNIQEVLTYNDFTYQDQSESNRAPDKSFQPFQPVQDKVPTLYLAFNRDVSDLPVTLFFHFHKNIVTCCENNATGKTAPQISWEYWSGTTWSALSVQDNTSNLTKQETIQFIVPQDIKKRNCFGINRHWIRAKLNRGEYKNFSKLSGIYTNTVWANNHATVYNETLGSSNGEENQVFKLSHSPVLPDQTILVREPALTDEEKNTIISEEGKDAITEIKDDAGNILEHWVRWHENGHFHYSGPHSRHYVLDRIQGEIVFGNGKRGLIPYPGKNNIKCGKYMYGGGSSGNVNKGTIIKMRTSIPYIDSVTNHEAAGGGADQEDIQKAKNRGPQTIKHRERAVSYEDFEWLTREASPQIAKVKCLPTTGPARQFKPGCITLIIVPESNDPKPLPTRELINIVESYLSFRAFVCLTSQTDQGIILLGPGYIKVSVDTVVKYKDISKAKNTEGQIIANLKCFFHPLRGGPDKKGWEFGRNVHISEVYEIIEKTEGVDYVESLNMKPSIQIYRLIINKNFKNFSALKQNNLVFSSDGKIIFSLAGKKAIDSQTTALFVAGFKQGDQVKLSNQVDGLNFTLTSVDGNALECETTWTAPSCPNGSIVETTFGAIKSVLTEEIPAESDITLLKTAIFKDRDMITIRHPDNPETSLTCKIETVDSEIETVYLDDNYLVYSGEHSAVSSKQ